MTAALPRAAKSQKCPEPYGFEKLHFELRRLDTQAARNQPLRNKRRTRS